MRENRTYGSEGGEAQKAFPTPIVVQVHECSSFARPSISRQSENAVLRIDVDGRDEPGHDGGGAIRSAPASPAWQLRISLPYHVGNPTHKSCHPLCLARKTGATPA